MLLSFTDFQAEVHKPAQIALLKNSCQTHSQYTLPYFYWAEDVYGTRSMPALVSSHDAFFDRFTSGTMSPHLKFYFIICETSVIHHPSASFTLRRG